MGDGEIAAVATKKARDHPRLTDDVIGTHGWENGMHPSQVPFLRKAMQDRLVRSKGGTIAIRFSTDESWRPLKPDDWAAIPRLD
jgi:hypothetical protein